MQGNSAICLVVERLRASALGAYGNTWFETPGLDRLASESLTLDQSIVDSPHLDRLCRSYWQGLHALRPPHAARDLPSLPAVLRTSGLLTALLTDQPEVADHPLAAAFHECVRVEAVDHGPPAQDTHQTQLARLLAVASNWLEEQSAPRRTTPFLLWVHARGMAGPWDAPLPLRNRLADEDDPHPPTGTDVPCRMLAADYDPDELFGAACAYAGQITVLSECIEALLDQLRHSRLSDSTLLTLIGARGFPLGEHGQIGPAAETLHSETIHVPWLIRLPDLSAALLRSQALTQPADLPATLGQWFGVATPLPRCDGHDLLTIVRGEVDDVRDRALVVSDRGEQALRTAAWYLRQGPATNPQLFVKPDDRWEVNDVADRCPKVVAGLTAAMAHLASSLQYGNAVEPAPLGPELPAAF